ncbi:hypothetical protein PQX77_008919 [Marasmius sp. AFHP31]|nr:hypothetical protein PQX77_008919 [Marasmius sp. AFHP31]
MPAHRRHTTKKAREQAIRDKNSKYYQQNKDVLRSKRRVKHSNEISVKRKASKAQNDERKRAFWEAWAQDEYERDTLQQLRNLEKSVNDYLFNSGSAYFDRIFHEYLAWYQSEEHNESPIELPYKVFRSMLDAVAKIGNGILNEYGAKKEWKECQRLTKRIRCLIQALDNLEEVVLVNEVGNSLEDRYSKGTLAFQGELTGQWLDRLHVHTFIASLDKL